jgi:predicted MPP superfamily phosphohydrolase
MLQKLSLKKADEWRPIFLKVLRNTANVRAACEKAGVTRQAAYKSRNASEEFRAQWDEAIEDAVDVLEAVAQDRARKTSDTLLIFLLKAHRPDKYREARGSTLNLNLSPDDIAKLDDDALAELERKLATLLR